MHLCSQCIRSGYIPTLCKYMGVLEGTLGFSPPDKHKNNLFFILPGLLLFQKRSGQAYKQPFTLVCILVYFGLYSCSLWSVLCSICHRSLWSVSPITLVRVTVHFGPCHRSLGSVLPITLVRVTDHFGPCY